MKGDRWFLQLSYAMVGLAVLALAISSAADWRRGRRASASMLAPAPTSISQPASVPTERTEEGAGSGLPIVSESASAPVPVALPRSSFFEEFRLERERERAIEIEIIQEVAEDPDTDSEVRRQAQAALLAAVSRARREFDAESMILARGYADAIVSLTDEGASVVVKSGRLEEADARAIGDIVGRAAGIGLSRITIAQRED